MDMHGFRLQFRLASVLTQPEDTGYIQWRGGPGFQIISGDGLHFTMEIGFMIIPTDGCGYPVMIGLLHG